MTGRKVWVGAVLVAMIAAGYVGGQAYMETSRNQQSEHRSQRERADAAALARCSTEELSDAGLREVVERQYKPAGIVWQNSVTMSSKLVLPPPVAPSGSKLYEFELKDRGLDWEAFQHLRKRCGGSSFGPPFNEGWRWFYWSAMESEPRFQAAVAQVKARNDQLLSGLREADAKQRRLNEGAEQARIQELESRVFRRPAASTSK